MVVVCVCVCVCKYTALSPGEVWDSQSVYMTIIVVNTHFMDSLFYLFYLLRRNYQFKGGPSGLRNYFGGGLLTKGGPENFKVE